MDQKIFDFFYGISLHREGMLQKMALRSKVQHSFHAKKAGGLGNPPTEIDNPRGVSEVCYCSNSTKLTPTLKPLPAKTEPVVLVLNLSLTSLITSSFS